jgi:hypothetical protein
VVPATSHPLLSGYWLISNPCTKTLLWFRVFYYFVYVIHSTNSSHALLLGCLQHIGAYDENSNSYRTAPSLCPTRTISCNLLLRKKLYFCHCWGWAEINYLSIYLFICYLYVFENYHKLPFASSAWSLPIRGVPMAGVAMKGVAVGVWGVLRMAVQGCRSVTESPHWHHSPQDVPPLGPWTDVFP